MAQRPVLQVMFHTVLRNQCTRTIDLSRVRHACSGNKHATLLPKHVNGLFFFGDYKEIGLTSHTFQQPARCQHEQTRTVLKILVFVAI